MELLFQETEEQGSTLVFVSHDQQIAKRFPQVVDLTEINQARHALS
jgi:predicted ABC-type transport system involved in lysophospholipase L1 biosynthesis ATPase subunit